MLVYLQVRCFLLIVSPDESPFGCDNLKNILVRPFKFGMWVYMGNATNDNCFVTLTFNFKVTSGQILAIFLHFGQVLIYRNLDHSMAGIY